MEKNSSSGIGLLAVIQVVLIMLKLLGIAPVATWTWTVVLIPLLEFFSIFISFLRILFLYLVQ